MQSKWRTASRSIFTNIVTYKIQYIFFNTENGTLIFNTFDEFNVIMPLGRARCN